MRIQLQIRQEWNKISERVSVMSRQAMQSLSSTPSNKCIQYGIDSSRSLSPCQNNYDYYIWRRYDRAVAQGRAAVICERLRDDDDFVKVIDLRFE